MQKSVKRVFLGGTVGNNHWRKNAIRALVSFGIPEDWLFNPVVDHWDAAAQRREDVAKRSAEFILFYLASPDPLNPNIANVSAYSMVEAIMGLYDDPQRTIVVIDTRFMNKHTSKALQKAHTDLITRFPTAPIFQELQPALEWLVQELAK